ncbi:MAG: hypothetical protein ACRDP6_39485, partial [Actinoallomurus sp.]
VETTVMRPITEPADSVGRPFVGEIKILDAGGQELRPGAVGEVWMRNLVHALVQLREPVTDEELTAFLSDST